MPACECGREFESKRGLAVHRRSCTVTPEPESPIQGAGTAPADTPDPFRAWVGENLRILSANDEALQAAIDEIRGKLSTTREPGAPPPWVDKAGDSVQEKMPDIIDTVLGVLKGLVNQPSEGDLFNFDPEFREYVKATLKDTLEARKKIVLRAVKDIEDGKLYYREGATREFTEVKKE